MPVIKKTAEKQLDSRLNQVTAESGYYELESERTALFEKIEAEAFALPREERVNLVHRILEHSMKDGMELARTLGLNRREIIAGITRDIFINKHPDLALKLNNRLQEYRHYVSDNESEDMNKFADAMLDKVDQPGEPNFKQTTGRTASNEFRDLKDQVDDYYAKLLSVRELKESEGKPDRTSRGEFLAERQLERRALALKPHYYSGNVAEILAVENSGIDFTPLRSKNLLTEDDILEFSKNNKVEINPTVWRRLEKARYKPLAITFQIGEEEASKTLLTEIKQSILRRGFSEDEFDIVLDKKTGKYKVVDKTKDKKTGHIDLRPENFRITKEISEKFEVAPGHPLYSKILKSLISAYQRDGKVFIEYFSDNIDVTNTRSPEEGDIFKLNRCIYVENGSVLEVLEFCHYYVILHDDGTTSEAFFGYPEDLQQQADKTIFLNNDSEDIGFDRDHSQFIVDEQRINKDLSTWHVRKYFEARNIVVCGQDIYWIGSRKEIDSQNQIIDKHALFKNGKIIFTTGYDGCIYELTKFGDSIAFITSEKDTKAVYKSVRTVHIGDQEFGPYEDVTLEIEGNSFFINGVKTNGTKERYCNQDNIPVKDDIQSVLVGGKIFYTKKTTEGYVLADQYGEPISEAFKHLIIYRNLSELVYWAQTFDNNFLLFFRGKEFNLKGTDINLKTKFKIIGDDLVYLEKYENNALASLQSGTIKFDGRNIINYFDVTADGRIVLQVTDHRKNGAVARIYEYSSGLILKKEEQKKIDLLNTVTDGSLDEIEGYFEKYHTDKKGVKEKFKEYLSGSKSFITTINKLLKEAPKEFIDSMSVARDDLTDRYLDTVVLSLFTETWQNLKKIVPRPYWRALNKIKSNPNAYFEWSPDSSSNYIDGGDPKKGQQQEVIHLREPISEMLTTNIFGEYNGKKWERAMFPVSDKFQGSTREVTIELLAVRENSRVILPKCPNAVLLKDRVKGINSRGKRLNWLLLWILWVRVLQQCLRGLKRLFILRQFKKYRLCQPISHKQSLCRLGRGRRKNMAERLLRRWFLCRRNW